MTPADLTQEPLPARADLTPDGLREGDRGGLLPLYLRFEPTTDPATLESYGQAGLAVPADHRDVVAYRDEAMTDRRACWRWHDRTRPRKGRRTVTLNGWTWRPVWRPEKKMRFVENSA